MSKLGFLLLIKDLSCSNLFPSEWDLNNRQLKSKILIWNKELQWGSEYWATVTRILDVRHKQKSYLWIITCTKFELNVDLVKQSKPNKQRGSEYWMSGTTDTQMVLSDLSTTINVTEIHTLYMLCL